MKTIVGVMGSAGKESVTPRLRNKALTLGQAIAAREVILLTGATTGLIYEVGKAARNHGALHVGVSPASNEAEHTGRYELPLDACDIMIYTGFGLKGRNVVLVRSCNIALFISGAMGSLNEFTIAHDEGKVIGCLTDTGGVADQADYLLENFSKQTGARVFGEENPELLLDKCLAALKSGRPVIKKMQQPLDSNADTVVAIHAGVDLRAAELDHAAWKSATVVPITRYWSGAEAPAGRRTEASVLWSDEAIHLRFVCRQTEKLIVSPNPKLDKKTLKLWDRDVCEVFLAPDPDKPERYFEFEAAPTGEWIDLAIHVTPEKRETDWEFHSGMSAAGRVTGEQVVIGMRIPWDDWIHKPQRGEKWRINLFRCVGDGSDRGYLTWQPTRTEQPNFHVPRAFGWLRFS